MRRRICYVTGTRADFGLMEPTLRAIHAHTTRLQLSLCVTGMHLSPEFGLTVKEVEATGFTIRARLPVDLSASDGASMARALGATLIGLVEVLSAERPDCLLLLGDRGEMLAGALAAVHLNIPIVHVGGGDRSGTVDEPIRHAISKLAHYHCVSTPGARQRLIQMGERPDRVLVTGAPGLDGVQALAKCAKADLCVQYGIDPLLPVALVLFHPVVQEFDSAGEQMREILTAVCAEGLQALCLMPNSDAGSNRIRDVLLEAHAHGDVRLITHLPRSEFLSWMAVADVLVGNSSCGIVESATFGLRVVNVGDRQGNRERNGNVVDCEGKSTDIRVAIERALTLPRKGWSNVYGDGKAAERIVELLVSQPLDRSLLKKVNAY